MVAEAYTLDPNVTFIASLAAPHYVDSKFPRGFNNIADPAGRPPRQWVMFLSVCPSSSNG